MAKNKRPKWLDAETPELLDTLKDIMAAEEITEKDQAKAAKIVDELIARIPTDDHTPISVAEAIAAAQTCMEAALENVKAAYNHEVSIIADTESEDEEEEAEEEESPAPKKKEKKSKKSKKAAKVEEPEEEEDEEEEEEEDSEEEDSEEEDDSAEDYSDWSTKDLKKECRTRGIKVTKSMGKAELVKALEADDKE